MNVLKFYKELEIDATNVLQRLNNSEALVEKFLKAFYYDQTFNELSVAMEANDFDQIEKTAHKLKGISSNFDLFPIYDFSSKIVIACRSNQTSSVQAIYDKLKVAYESTMLILGKHLEIENK